MNKHTSRLVLVASLSSGLFACGSDSTGSGGGGGEEPSGSTSSVGTGSTSSSSSASSSVASSSGGDAGGSAPTSSGAGGEDPGVGGSGGSGAGGDGPVCTGEVLCSVIADTEAKDCEAFLVPLTEEQAEGARCVLESLRDRAEVTVVVGFSDGFGYCDRTQTITVRPEALFVRDERYEDKGGTIRSRGYEVLDAAVYQACLDLPDEELHTCLGFEGELFGDATDCPDGCTCGDEEEI